MRIETSFCVLSDVCASLRKFMQSLRKVYAEFMQSLRRVYGDLRKVYAEFTPGLYRFTQCLRRGLRNVYACLRKDYAGSLTFSLCKVYAWFTQSLRKVYA